MKDEKRCEPMSLRVHPTVYERFSFLRRRVKRKRRSPKASQHKADGGRLRSIEDQKPSPNLKDAGRSKEVTVYGKVLKA